jgi:hypothetical protein
VQIRSRITLFQLFFLSFAYVFSGLFLLSETAVLSLLIPLISSFACCVIGFLYLRCLPTEFSEKERWISFLSCGRPYAAARVFACIFSAFGAVELILSWTAFVLRIFEFSDFLPISLVAAVSLFLAVFVGAHGLSVVGRLSELLAFLIVPLILWAVLWDFAPLDLRSFGEEPCAWIAVLPSPSFYLLSMTVLRSTAMPNAARKPIRIPLISFCGAVAAVVCAFLFLFYGAGEENIFRLFFGWMATLIRLSLLVCVCTERFGKKESLPRREG